MTGWTKVILATAVMTLAIIGLNVALWRRLRAARLARERTEGEPEPPLP